MRSFFAQLVVAFPMLCISPSCIQAGVVTFGGGSNSFGINFVEIGDVGNAADTTGSPNPVGSVSYRYGISKFEVTRGMIQKYNAEYGSGNGLGITLSDMSAFNWRANPNGVDRPATGVSWNEAARFVNWLNTSTGFQAAYKFAEGSGVNDNLELWTDADAGYNALNPYRNTLAKYFIPNSDEWYKAAYYKSADATYYDFANGSDTAPSTELSGTTANTAVWNLPFEYGPADAYYAGGLSPYGVMGLTGNVLEWEETSFDLLNSSGSSNRAIRGGWWNDYTFAGISSSRRDAIAANYEDQVLGFRVGTYSAAVPEPSMMAIGTLLGLGGLFGRRQMKK